MKAFIVQSSQSPLQTTAQSGRVRQWALLAAPFVLLATTYGAYQGLVAWLGLKPGYLAGFLFYWLFWCFLFPLWLVGKAGLRTMFRAGRPNFPQPVILSLLLLFLPLVGGFFVMTLPRLPHATFWVVVVSAVIALVNAVGEEILWRGTYLQLFANDRIRGSIYPTLMFGLWHLAPTSVVGNPWVIVTSATFVGLVYGWVAWRTGSIRWTTIFHVLTDFTGLIGVFYLSP